MNTVTPAPAARPKKPRAPYLVKVEPPAPTPLLRVFVAGNPTSSNHMYGARGYAAAKRLTPEARAWRDAVAYATMAWRYPNDAPRPNLSVSCLFLGARADVDNLLNLTLDGLKEGLMVDDRYVLRVCAEKRSLSAGTERGAWIEVTELPPVEAQRAPRKTRNKRTA